MEKLSAKYNIIWLRNDLRIADNPALYHAFKDAEQEECEVLPIFILDEANERALGGASKWFLHKALKALEGKLGKIHYFEGDAIDIIEQLKVSLGDVSIYYNRKYTAEAISRDTEIKERFNALSFNGSLLFEPWEIQNKQGSYYKVFTAFWRACMENEVRPCYDSNFVIPAQVGISFKELPEIPASVGMTTLEGLNLLPTSPDWSGGFDYEVSEEYANDRLEYFLEEKVDEYKEGRNFPDKDITSKLSPYLAWGVISPRQVYWKTVYKTAGKPESSAKDIEQFLFEIGWREFSYHLLYNNPELAWRNFRPDFDNFPWQKNDELLEVWKRGQTGYPIVDAGMRELWHTGWMHNRVRMIVASFLTKHLLIHWSEGEKWFWDCLTDADSASNSASWQWVAGCGADAAPYFRIFNPITQGEKFDKTRAYVRKWVPEVADLPDDLIYRPWEASPMFKPKDYPAPIVEHSQARERALLAYEAIKKKD